MVRVRPLIHSLAAASLAVGTLVVAAPHALAIEQPTVHAKRLHNDMHSCDIPEKPCATAEQMSTWLRNNELGFYQLTDSYDFPLSFIDKAWAGYYDSCKQHPVICKAVRKRVAAHQRQVHYVCHWWCYQRMLISCAGGTLVPYYDCNGAVAPVRKKILDRDTSTATKVEVALATSTLIVLMPEGAPMVLTGIAAAGFNTWFDAVCC